MFIQDYTLEKYILIRVLYYIPVSHDMMRQTNDCSPVRVMQHKVMYFDLELCPRVRPSGWVDLELCPRVWSNPAPNLGLYSIISGKQGNLVR